MVEGGGVRRGETGGGEGECESLRRGESRRGEARSVTRSPHGLAGWLAGWTCRVAASYGDTTVYVSGLQYRQAQRLMIKTGRKDCL